MGEPVIPAPFEYRASPRSRRSSWLLRHGKTRMCRGVATRSSTSCFSAAFARPYVPRRPSRLDDLRLRRGNGRNRIAIGALTTHCANRDSTPLAPQQSLRRMAGGLSQPRRSPGTSIVGTFVARSRSDGSTLHRSSRPLPHPSTRCTVLVVHAQNVPHRSRPRISSQGMFMTALVLRTC